MRRRTRTHRTGLLLGLLLGISGLFITPSLYWSLAGFKDATPKQQPPSLLSEDDPSSTKERFAWQPVNNELLDNDIKDAPLEAPSEAIQPTIGSAVVFDDNYEFRLKVPFYVYDNGLNWADTTTPEGIPIGETEYPDFKHSDDYWMLMSTFNHPMRTTDPSEAKLFFVPLLMNLPPFLWKYRVGTYCIHNRTTCFDHVDAIDVVERMDALLGESEYFQRSNGADHVLVLSHFFARSDRKNKFKTCRNMLSCNRVVFENHPQTTPEAALPYRITLPSLYVANHSGCEATDNKTADFAMIASLMPKKKHFQDRRNICQWLKEGNHSYSVCGEGEMCPALAEAKYGFHVRGDTFGSNRLMDTIMTDMVPIFTNVKQYNILPDFAPVDKFGYFVDLANRRTFDQSINAILATSDEEYRSKRSFIKKYKSLVDFRSGVPFDEYMASFAKRLGMQQDDD
mmetsp:Transcript_28291/g.79475  ORF Transcript_28291/g.79475 Transcript_28291/m.79475 type:complete len:453 (+) Transcript_28291:37-1395(+)